MQIICKKKAYRGKGILPAVQQTTSPATRPRSHWSFLSCQCPKLVNERHAPLDVFPGIDTRKRHTSHVWASVVPNKDAGRGCGRCDVVVGGGRGWQWSDKGISEGVVELESEAVSGVWIVSPHICH